MLRIFSHEVWRNKDSKMRYMFQLLQTTCENDENTLQNAEYVAESVDTCRLAFSSTV